MSKLKRLTAKESAAIEYYTEPNSDSYNNWCKSCTKAGYSQKKGWQGNAFRVKAKEYIKRAIKERKASFEAKIDVSREYCVEKLQDIVDNSKKERNRIAAMSLIGDFCGFKRETAPNTEKEAAKRRLTAEEQRYLDEYARKRTADKAQEPQRAKIVKLGA